MDHRRHPPLLPGRDHLLHGGDWNPDQWPEELIDVDLRLMGEARATCAAVGIFAWARLEPEEGRFDFAWLDRVMERCAAAGVAVMLATPSAAQPAWLSRTHPEVLRVHRSRKPRAHGTRVNWCPSSALYRDLCVAMAERLAARYAGHPALALWHVSNEYHGYCFCERCAESFRGWLERRHGGIEALNRDWNTAFWSHRFSSFAEIDPPGAWDPEGGWGEFSMAALELDWRRFHSDQAVAFMQAESAPLRRLAPGVPVTTNLMGTYVSLDAWRFAKACDVVSWDCYPCYQEQAGVLDEAVSFSFQHDAMRALGGGRPFLLMESSPSSVNWMPYQRLKRPGIHRLGSLQAVAHGADSVQYFQWRAGRGGAEKFHGAVVGHDGRGDTRVFAEVAGIGRTLERLRAVRGTTVAAQVAVVYDWEVRWAHDIGNAPSREARDYEGPCRAHYRPYWQAGVAVDVIDQTAPLDPYRLVVAPQCYLLRPGFAERLDAFVRAGGTLVLSAWSGIADENDLCFLGGRPGPLRALAGVRVEETDGLRPEDALGVEAGAEAAPFLAGAYRAGTIADLCHAEGAEVLATFSGAFYAGRPALTRHRVGAGSVWYLATRPEQRLLDDLHGGLIAGLGLPTALPGPLPHGVTVQLRSDGVTDFVFLLNFTGAAQTVDLGGRAHIDAETGTALADRCPLAAWGSRVLSRPSLP